MAIDRSKYPGVPEDFPIEEVLGAVPGAQLKFLMVEEDGKYYATGTSPSEVQEAYAMCEDLTQQLTVYCRRKSQLGQEPQALLIKAHQYLLQQGWCIPAQSLWICAQVAKALDWQLPQELQGQFSPGAEGAGGGA